MKSVLRARRASSASSFAIRDESRPDILISIDPGISGTGWAVWDGPSCPYAVGVTTTPTTGLWHHRAHGIAASLDEKLHDALDQMQEPGMSYGDVQVWIEFPILMESVKGVAAQRGGSTLKLAYLIGVIAERSGEGDVRLVSPLQWKGQLPKSVVEHRVRRYLGADVCRQLNIRTHAWDAVGIGLYGWGIR